MKRANFTVFLLLLLISNNIFSQCPGCITDMNFTVTPAEPALSPDTLPNGTALQPYDQDVSFYMPATFLHSSGFTLTLDEIEIIDVLGVPYGLHWQSSGTNNKFYPSSNPPTTEHGCAKFCGTPLIPGNYIITVMVKASVTYALGSTSQNSSFNIPITILPGSTGNTNFTIANPQGCAPINSTFINHNPNPGYTPTSQTTGFTYLWNFGNGNTTTLENPTSQSYFYAGNYPINYTCNIDTVGYYLTNVDITAIGCTDGYLGGDPEVYIEIWDGSNTKIYTTESSTITGTCPFNFPLNIKMVNPPYTIQVWDDDSPLDDDNCVNNNEGVYDFITLNLPSLTTFGSNTYIGTNSSLTISYTINKPVITFTSSDTIKVFPVPSQPVISFTPNDSVCSGDTIILTSSSTNNNQWYFNDTLIYGANSNKDTVYNTGIYKVVVTNTYGCSNVSLNKHITFVSNPPQPQLWSTKKDTIETNVPSTGFFIQWYRIAGTTTHLINGANQNTYIIDTSGGYFLIISNSFGCQYISDTLNMVYVNGIDINLFESTLNIYPNPASGIFTISFDNLYDISLITITNMLGQNLYNENVPANNIHFEKQIDVSSFPKGIYLIKLIGNNFNKTYKLSIN